MFARGFDCPLPDTCLPCSTALLDSRPAPFSSRISSRDSPSEALNVGFDVNNVNSRNYVNCLSARLHRDRSRPGTSRQDIPHHANATTLQKHNTLGLDG